MVCRYCGTVNDRDEHRCGQCGRRLAGQFDVAYTSQGSAVTELHPVTPPAVEPERKRAPYQPQLFTTREIGRVVPIESFQPRPPDANQERRQRPVPRPRKAGSDEGQPDPQTDLAFPDDAAPVVGPARAQYRKTGAAPVTQRAMAAVVDLSLVLISLAPVAGIIYAIIGDDFLNHRPFLFFAPVAAILALSYKLLWAMAGTESPGVGWIGLRLANFDGRQANRDERLRRVLWACLSVAPAGLGLIWAVFDEERLTWHDHATGTYLAALPEAR